MIWRLYPFALLAGGVACSAVALLFGILGGIIAIITGLDVSHVVVLQRSDVTVFLLIASVASFMTAGCVAARFSPGEEIVNAVAMGALLVLAGALDVRTLGSLPQWLAATVLVLAVPSALAGGFLYRGREPAAQQCAPAAERQ